MSRFIQTNTRAFTLVHDESFHLILEKNQTFIWRILLTVTDRCERKVCFWIQSKEIFSNEQLDGFILRVDVKS